MKQINFVLFMALTMLLSACSNKLTIDTEYSKATDFQNFKYYRWHAENANNKQPDNQLLDQNIRFMIDQQLAKQGMIKKEEGQIDFLVNYSIASHKKVDIEEQRVYDTYTRNFQSYNGFGYSGHYHRGVGITFETTSTDELLIDKYKQGTMSIDFLEPDDKNIIWTAIADKRIPKNGPNASKRDKYIEKVIKKLLSNFPPK